MKTNILFAAAYGMVAIVTQATAAEPPAPRFVMTWVPPYAIEKCRALLNDTYGGFGPRDALTHVALQFWLPTKTGGIEKTDKYGIITDATVMRIHSWARIRGIRTMLCVYNNTDTWDWSLAQAAFAGHREDFVNAVVKETQRLALDGVDVDLEGNGQFDASKESYVAFIRELATRLHALGKQITVDSFAYKWNAPNQTWWAELLPIVDGLNSMGYEQTGAHAPGWQSYAAQKTAAGANAAKLLIGIPADKPDWTGTSAAENIDWIVRDPSVGIAIWDAQFSDPYWKTAIVWKTLARMKQPGK
jgi:hypothetical protein